MSARCIIEKSASVGESGEGTEEDRAEESEGDNNDAVEGVELSSLGFPFKILDQGCRG